MIEQIEQNQKTQGGIYAILNKHTDRIYIGQTVNFSKRWNTHQNLLLKNKHRNKILQNDFNKCFKELGNSDFLEFSVIEIVLNIKDKELLTEREQVYLDAFINSGSCYNIVKKARIEDRSCFSKTPEETREKKSNNSKKMWENPKFREKTSKSMKKVWENPEFREEKSRSMKKVWENPENIKKISEAMKKAWENPELREEKSRSMKKAYENPENIKKISEAMKKAWENPENIERKSNATKKNWENPGYREKMSNASKKVWDDKLSILRAIVISPNGQEFEVYNIRKFARENNLLSGGFNLLINGKCKSHRKWTLKK